MIVASDSRLGGGERWDACAKTFDVGRDDALLAFAGNTCRALPLVFQAVATTRSYNGSTLRTLDLHQFAKHLESVLNAVLDEAKGPASREVPECEFLLAADHGDSTASASTDTPSTRTTGASQAMAPGPAPSGTSWPRTRNSFCHDWRRRQATPGSAGAGLQQGTHIRSDGLPSSRIPLQPNPGLIEKRGICGRPGAGPKCIAQSEWSTSLCGPPTACPFLEGRSCRTNTLISGRSSGAMIPESGSRNPVLPRSQQHAPRLKSWRQSWMARTTRDREGSQVVQTMRFATCSA